MAKSLLYLQTKQGGFVPAPVQPWGGGGQLTVADALFFDADGDGDADLYLVSGGADFPLNSSNYQDQLFENDGQGHFRFCEHALPPETVSGSCARAADVNKDGLPDLFIGGKLKPGFYPQAPESFILKNRSVPGNIRFEKDAGQTDTLLRSPGMVTDAAWADINKDGWPDLVVVGECMPVTVFENHAGHLKAADMGLNNTNGWWTRIQAADLDQDGNIDLVLGNLGLNTAFSASEQKPLTITYGDFYGNGSIIPIISAYNGVKSYPLYSKDELTDQLPSLQKKFLHYADFADAGLDDILSKAQLAAAPTIAVKTLESAVWRNNGAGKFIRMPLPRAVQESVVNGIVIKDIDHDGKLDLILAGNFYPFRAQAGPLDAGKGLVLKGDGRCGFRILDNAETNLYLPGDVRNLIGLQGKGRFFVVAAVNNDRLEVFEQVNK